MARKEYTLEEIRRRRKSKEELDRINAETQAEYEKRKQEIEANKPVEKNYYAKWEDLDITNFRDINLELDLREDDVAAVIKYKRYETDKDELTRVWFINEYKVDHPSRNEVPLDECVITCIWFTDYVDPTRFYMFWNQVPEDTDCSFRWPQFMDELVDGTFFNMKRIKKVVIPKSIKSIGNGVFLNCGLLNTVDMYDNVTELGVRAFMDCKNLEKVFLSDNIQVIPDSCFFNSGIRNLDFLPEAVTKIEKSAFAQCNKLRFVTLPKNVSYIGKQAFASCYFLERVVIENPDVTIMPYAFYGCENLKEIIVDGVNQIDKYIKQNL